MCPVSLIHDQRDSMSVADLRDPSHIRTDAVIGRGGDDDSLNRMFRGPLISGSPFLCRSIPVFFPGLPFLFQELFHILRADRAVYPQRWNLLWIKIFRLQISQFYGMIHGPVAVPGRQNPASPAGAAGDGA